MSIKHKFIKAFTRVCGEAKGKLDEVLDDMIQPEHTIRMENPSASTARNQISEKLEQELTSIMWAPLGSISEDSDEVFFILRVFPQDTGDGYTLNVAITKLRDRRYAATVALSDFLQRFTPVGDWQGLDS